MNSNIQIDNTNMNVPEIKQNNNTQTDVLDSNIIISGNSDFNALVIKPNNIDNLNWRDGNYLNYIMNMSIFENKKIEHEKFTYHIGLIFECDKKKNININTLIIDETPNYLYEILFPLHFKTDELDDNQKNGLGKLIHPENINIYGNILLLKTHLPIENYESTLVESNKEDLYNLLNRRSQHKTVIYEDNEWDERKWTGEFDKWISDFFDGDKYEHIELAFLKHNLNIYYIKSTNGISLGNLIKNKIERCVFTTKKTDEYWGDISLNEVKKIIDIAKITDNFNVDPDIDKEEKDDIGRKILKNKYRILNLMWKKLIN